MIRTMKMTCAHSRGPNVRTCSKKLFSCMDTRIVRFTLRGIYSVGPGGIRAPPEMGTDPVPECPGLRAGILSKGDQADVVKGRGCCFLFMEGEPGVHGEVAHA